MQVKVIRTKSTQEFQDKASAYMGSIPVRKEDEQFGEVLIIDPDISGQVGVSQARFAIIDGKYELEKLVIKGQKQEFSSIDSIDFE